MPGPCEPATLAGAIEDLDERGFTEHFVLRNGRLRALNTGKNFAADQVVIVESSRQASLALRTDHWKVIVPIVADAAGRPLPDDLSPEL